jgi:hypothetical protein
MLVAHVSEKPLHSFANFYIVIGTKFPRNSITSIGTRYSLVF